MLAATTLGFAVVQLDVSVVNVSLRSIGAQLGGSVTGLQWIVDAYTVAFAALILSAGALGDRLGAKRLFVAGFAVFTIASAGCGLAPSLGVLVAARAVQGIGAAALVPCSLSLLTHGYPDRGERARAVGLWAAGASVALSAGPLVGGVLTAALGWRSIFFVNAPLGVLGILLTWRYAAETSRSKDRRLDVAGQLTGVLALIALAAATVEGGRKGFGDPLVLAGFGVAAAAAAGFVLVEQRHRSPMLPLPLFRSGTFAAFTAIGLVVNTAFYGLIFVLSLYFQRDLHLQVVQTGLAFAPTTVAVGLANVLAARLAAATSTRTVLLTGGVMTAAGSAAMLGANAHSSYPQLVAQLVVIGFGLGLVVPTMTAGILGSVDPQRSGIASGTLNTARQTGSVLGVAVFGSLAAGSLVPGLRIDLAVTAVLAVTISLLALPAGQVALSERRHSDRNVGGGTSGRAGRCVGEAAGSRHCPGRRA